MFGGTRSIYACRYAGLESAEEFGEDDPDLDQDDDADDDEAPAPRAGGALGVPWYRRPWVAPVAAGLAGAALAGGTAALISRRRRRRKADVGDSVSDEMFGIELRDGAYNDALAQLDEGVKKLGAASTLLRTGINDRRTRDQRREDRRAAPPQAVIVSSWTPPAAAPGWAPQQAPQLYGAYGADEDDDDVDGQIDDLLAQLDEDDDAYGLDLSAQIAEIENQVVEIAKKYISMLSVPKMLGINKKRDNLIDSGYSSSSPEAVAFEKQALALLSGISQPEAGRLWTLGRKRDNLRRQSAGRPTEPVGTPPQLV